MSAKPVSPEEVKRRLKAYEKHGRNAALAAEALGIPRSTLWSTINKYDGKDADKQIEYPQLPDDDIPVGDIIDLMSKRFEKRHTHERAKKWMPITIRDNLPIGVSFFGDPHVDDNGCNWPLLKEHCELHKTTPGLYGVNIGDTTNNWTGRLAKLFANQDTSQSTARKLAEWFLCDSGITWACWLQGNHDLWGDGSEILRRMNTRQIPMHDWQAQFKLIFPNERECRIWAAHNFAGHSMWNTLHGAQKTAHMKDWAHIFASGHHHNFATHQEESASREFVYTLIRARGYKYIDEYAELNGHASQRFGAAITVLIDPYAPEDSFVSAPFINMEAAADYLTYLRKKRAK